MRKAPAPTWACTAAATILWGSSLAWPTQADDWPQWLGPKRDGVWRETGVLEALPSEGLRVKWRVPVGGGYAGPAVADRRVYVTDRHVAPGAHNPTNPFQRFSIPGTERVLCLDADTGRVLWVHEYECNYTVSYPAGPRATPLVAGDRVYTLGAEGHLHCLNAKTGQVIWSRYFEKDFSAKTPTWGFASHPLLVGDTVVCLVGAPDGLVMAFDKDTGDVRWKALTGREPGYAPPTLIQVEGRTQLLIWHPQAVEGLEPTTGRVLWSYPWRIREGLSIATPRQDGQRLFLTAFYDGPLMLQLESDPPGVRLLWKGRKRSERDTDGLHSLMVTPHIVDGYIYGVCSYGQLRCLKAETGERIWETCAATTGQPTRWGNAFLVRHTNRFFLFNERGDLILARLTPTGYHELGRSHVLGPTNKAAGRPVLWSHPAFARRCLFVRNDRELVCVWLGEDAAEWARPAG